MMEEKKLFAYDCKYFVDFANRDRFNLIHDAEAISTRHGICMLDGDPYLTDRCTEKDKCWCGGHEFQQRFKGRERWKI